MISFEPFSMHNWSCLNIFETFPYCHLFLLVELLSMNDLNSSLKLWHLLIKYKSPQIFISWTNLYTVNINFALYLSYTLWFCTQCLDLLLNLIHSSIYIIKTNITIKVQQFIFYLCLGQLSSLRKVHLIILMFWVLKLKFVKPQVRFCFVLLSTVILLVYFYQAFLSYP